MDINAQPLKATGLYKDNQLTAIIVHNGKPTHYMVEEWDNQDAESFYEVGKAQYASGRAVPVE